ncbi:DUF2333 family protein [Desulfobacca acetoxidans]|uniref:Uncharacterized conserved protein UCP029693 n=1 Tax=Desulfobacca acetoxidans (strain ATCC 700848 / DSM 11109 / ASRB2) TaxID=880072 RepID=F2NHU7_DESAR|nr:DUF2333 family protein [Desulfobacca acetoxidans]AEB09432.1 Uncharacterized conserved protein UCP029693 [Desulfobacca acetoxidans DSM 11109]
MTIPNTSPEETLPTPSPPSPPPSGWRRYRLIIICLVILVFLVYIFAASESKRVQQTIPPEEIVAKSTEPTIGLETEVPERLPEPEPAPVRPAPSIVPEAGKPSERPEPKIGGLPGKPGEPTEEKTTTLPPLPLPSPVVEASGRKVKGEAFTRSLIKIMDDEVNKSFFGWRPNTIIFGIFGLTDDKNNLQLGVLEVARRTAVVLNENMSRFAMTEAQNPYLNEAMNFFMVSADKYWFPSASGKYREAMSDLERYIDDLKNNRSRFYTRVDNLIALMNHFRDLLGSAFHNLIKDTEADGKSISWFVCDDYFYFSQGVALGMAEVLEGVKEDFADQLQKKNSFKLVEDAIHALHTGAHLSPWIVTNAAKDGILANHRANMATYIGEAEHVISTLVTVLATN